MADRVDGPRIAGLPYCDNCGWSPQFCRCDWVDGEPPPFEIRCNCAHVPPTMPTCRDTHLPSCPVGRFEEIVARRDAAASAKEGGSDAR